MKFSRKVMGVLLTFGCFLAFGVVCGAKSKGEVKTQKEEFGEIKTNPVRRFCFSADFKNSADKLNPSDVTKVFVAFYCRFNEILRKYNLEKLGLGEKSLLFFMVMNRIKAMNIENLNEKLKDFSFEFFKGNKKLDAHFEKFVRNLKSGKVNEIKITESGFNKDLKNIKTNLKSFLDGLIELEDILKKYVGGNEISDAQYKEVGMKIFDINMKNKGKDVEILRERVKENSFVFKETIENLLNEENIKNVKKMIVNLKNNLSNIENINFDEIKKISENITFNEDLKDITKESLGGLKEEDELKLENLLCLVDPKAKMNFCGTNL